MDKRYAAKFAPASNLNVLKSDLSTLEDEVAQISTENFVEKVDGMGLSSNDFTDDDKKLLEQLKKDNDSTFDASDVADIFDD